MNTREIRNMSRAERLAATEVLWDSLVCDQPEIGSPNRHRGILEQRKQKIEAVHAGFSVPNQGIARIFQFLS